MTMKDACVVKLLDFLERSVERVIQGPVDSIFRQEIQPAEIERHLERAMLDNRRRASGANIMPNTFLVELSPVDYATIEPYRTSLVRRLESWLIARAEVHNGTLLDRMQVEIQESGRARRRRPVVTAAITDIDASFTRRQGRRQAPAQPTETYRVASTGAPCALRLLTGQHAGATYTIPEGSLTLGRAADSDIRVEAPDVSRHHLRIERRGDRVEITDLGSTNGTRVNGERLHHAALRNGDEILVGMQALRFVTT
jgi:hypothetical protein